MKNASVPEDRVLGDHPTAHVFAEILTAKDERTSSDVAHRALAERDGSRDRMVSGFRTMLCEHHVSPEALVRARQHLEALRQLGLDTQHTDLRRFPKNPSTQKGNLAEVVLAEYLMATNNIAVPVYRLRYNPNVDQSMKGDDVLAFDLDANPTRIIVGEAKLRASSTAAAVTEIVDGLTRSHSVGIPVSLQFVAERLFESDQVDLGRRVFDCAVQFALGALRIDYVGLLLSDTDAARRVNSATPNALHRLAMISLGIQGPDSLVDACYQELDSHANSA